ncbi:hypothetical protein [Actinomadura xylanilytica]|uniref:hypothetical protein n=1 Tax=Actinomadura xylanilytica TaxID=887459 RepID=UPI00255B2871|nr:hypothetical protein [Actinomadura xylanilytica]MDL4773956.1 hypothetical protein [Actinomadura xylanilytica]
MRFADGTPRGPCAVGCIRPRVVYLREAEILGPVEGWLATAFSPDRIATVIEAMMEQATDPTDDPGARLRKELATCDRRLNQYRGALDAGADPAEVTCWINDVKRERARLEAQMRTVPHRDRVSRDEITDLLDQTGALAQMVLKAHPLDKADLFQELGLAMTYYPQKREVEVQIVPEPPHVRSVRVRGAIAPDRTFLSRLGSIGEPCQIVIGA